MMYFPHVHRQTRTVLMLDEIAKIFSAEIQKFNPAMSRQELADVCQVFLFHCVGAESRLSTSAQMLGQVMMQRVPPAFARDTKLEFEYIKNGYVHDIDQGRLEALTGANWQEEYKGIWDGNMYRISTKPADILEYQLALFDEAYKRFFKECKQLTVSK